MRNEVVDGQAVGPAFRRCLRAALLFLAGGAAAAHGQQTPPTFTAEVELITVDAVVVDSHGRPVAGLTQDDFVVLEDGRAQPILRFEAFALEPEAWPAASVVASNEPATRRTGRAFGILLDDVSISPPTAESARRAVATFLERSARDGDEVVLGTTSGEVWWSARLPEGREDFLAVLSRVRGHEFEPPALDRMTEHEAYRISNYEDSPPLTGTSGSGLSLPGRAASMATDPAPVPGGLGGTAARVKRRWEEAGLCRGAGCDGMLRGRAHQIDARRRGRLRLTFRALRRGLDALAPVRGRKSLLLLSEGFLEDTGPELRQVAAASREANTAIYFVDARGLAGIAGFGSAADPGRLPDQADLAATRFEATSLASAGAETLADATGGFSVRNTNDLAAGAARIANESRVFYLLGFPPPEGKGPGVWRNLRVEVKRPGLTVRARRGYMLRTAATGAEAGAGKSSRRTPDPAIARALDSADQAAGIPLRAMAYVFEPRPKDATHVVVAAELDASRVVLRAKGAKREGRLDVSVVAIGRDGGRGFRHDETLELSLAGAETPGWRAFAREFELPPGVFQARVVVRDPASGALGSVWQRLEVPPPDVLRLSTPILTDRLEPAANGQSRPQPALAVHRVFRPAGVLYCQFQVFGAAVPEGGGPPRVTAGLQLKRAGVLVRDADPTPITPDPDGRLVRLVGLGLDGLEEGDYELWLAVRDQVSGDRLERVEPFTLARDPGK